MPDLLRSTPKARPNLSRVFSAGWRAAKELLLSLFLALPLVAVADEPAAFSVSGFGTLGVARTNTHNAEFVRDLSQTRGATDQWQMNTDSLLGLQMNYQLTPQLGAVVQAVSRYRYDKTYTPDISWAFLKYDPNPQLSLRAGRLGTEFFMLADSRLVGYSYLTVRPPGDFFWSLPFYSIEGADAALSLPLGDAVLRGKVFSGISHEKVALADEMWDLSGSRMSGAYLDYLDGPWMLRASYANIRFKNNLPINKVMFKDLVNTGMAQGMARAVADQAHEYMATENKGSDYFSLGMLYEQGPWQVQVMLNHIHQDSQAFEYSKAAYVLAGYRVGAVTPYLGYSQVASQTRPYAPNAAVARAMADSHAHESTWIFGARWDVARHVALKVQADVIKGKPDSIFPFRRENANWSGKMNVFSATLDFVF